MRIFQKRIPLKEAFMTVFAVFVLLVAYNMFAYDMPVSPVEASMDEPSVIDVPDMAEATTIETVVTVTAVAPEASKADETRPEIVSRPVKTVIIPAMAPVALENADVPVRIKISSIGVDAAVNVVGETSAGAMDVPANATDTGWYELGPYPGDVGSAVIGGHVEWPYRSAAVFVDLRELKTGDVIEVLNGAGETVSFVVRETRMYDADADATDVFTSNDGKAHLNIITCAGVWDAQADQYSQRLVVFTDKVTE